MKKQILSFSLVVAGFFLGATALSALAQTWSPPGTGYPVGTNCTPPNCNVPAPINVGSSLQEKLGSLLLDGNLRILGNLVVATSSPQKGDILTAQDDSGTAAWEKSNAENAETVYDSGWVSIKQGTPMTFNHNLGFSDLLVQVFASQVAAGSYPVIVSSFSEVNNGSLSSGGVIINSISNSNITLTPLSKVTISPIQNTGLSSTVSTNSFGYIRVLAKKAPAGTIIGQRIVRTNWSNYIDIRVGTLINKECPPNASKQYTSGAVSSNITGDNSDGDNNFVCIETITP